jgi:hypothetical protein
MAEATPEATGYRYTIKWPEQDSHNSWSPISSFSLPSSWPTTSGLRFPKQ